MTLYHYVRTKDELLSLLTDAVMGELILPDAKLRGSWRDAITNIAHASRAAFERHSWLFDIVDDPDIGPNGVRHFDQSWQAVATLPGTFADKLDVIHAVDEYVFGYVMHARNDFQDDGELDEPMRAYVTELVATGEYPTLAGLADEIGTEELWTKIQKHSRDPRRFDRNLARLLDGVERSLERSASATPSSKA
jgi:AcrR family transcriptional regulator